MACNITGGLTKSCGYLVGGANQIHLSNFYEISAWTSGSTVWTTGATNPSWFEMQFEKGTGSYISELVVNNGQKSVRHAVSFSLAKKDQTVLTRADELSLGTFVALVRDRNNIRVGLGRTNGLESTITSVSTGLQETDFGGLVVTMEGLQTEHAFVYAGTV